MHLQVFKADEYSVIANSARGNFVTLKARRGDIVDRKGNLLATTRSVVEVGMDPHSVRAEDRIKFPELGRLLNVPLAVLNEAANKLTRRVGEGISEVRNVRWVKLKEEVDEGTYAKIQALEIKEFMVILSIPGFTRIVRLLLIWLGM